MPSERRDRLGEVEDHERISGTRDAREVSEMPGLAVNIRCGGLDQMVVPILYEGIPGRGQRLQSELDETVPFSDRLRFGIGTAYQLVPVEDDRPAFIGIG